MEQDSTKALGKVIRIDEGEVRGHLDKLVRGTVEETLNALLDEEADRMFRAQRYERSPERIDTRAGHYSRKLHTQAGEVECCYVYLDGMALKRSWGGEIKNLSILAAIGVDAGGREATSCLNDPMGLAQIYECRVAQGNGQGSRLRGSLKK